jgi:hypothetical protein
MATPVSDAAVSQIVYLPSNVFLSNPADMADIVDAIRKVARALPGSRA